ncbi:MAG: glycosyltransferase [Gemmatimonadetes bacterium]|nr:MAG: glycosyltransferase [Gemmatimonadota bacterium]
MNILQITAWLPYPPEGGGKLEVFNSIKFLSSRHSITLVSFIREGEEQYLRTLESYCESVHVIPHSFNYDIFKMFVNLFSNTPYTIERYNVPEMAELIKTLVRDHAYDLVRIDHLHMAQYRPFCGELPVVLRCHNIENHIMKRFYQHTTNPFVKFYAYLQWKKLHQYEIDSCSLFNRCLMISPVDEQFLHAVIEDVETALVTAGVDDGYFHPNGNVPVNPRQLVFTGDMIWRPNDDGVLWFIDHILPLIQAHIPDVTFYVVGRNPSDRLLTRQDEHIIITGRVEDVRPYVHQSSIFVVPLRIGGGMRLKILEAMAMKKAVVSTSIGAEGIHVKSGENILLADTPDAFAEAIITLLEEPELRCNIAQNGYKLIQEQYTWERIAERLEQVYIDVLNEMK